MNQGATQKPTLWASERNGPSGNRQTDGNSGTVQTVSGGNPSGNSLWSPGQVDCGYRSGFGRARAGLRGREAPWALTKGASLRAGWGSFGITADEMGDTRKGDPVSGRRQEGPQGPSEDRV